MNRKDNLQTIKREEREAKRGEIRWSWQFFTRGRKDGGDER